MSEKEAVTIVHQRSVDERFDIVEQQFQFIAIILKELTEKVDSLGSTKVRIAATKYLPSIRPLLHDDDLERITGIGALTWPARRQRGDCPPFVKLGRGRSALVRYRPEDVEAWLDGQVHRSTSDTNDTA